MTSAPTYAVRLNDGTIIDDLSWTNASEQVRLYGAEWVHNYDEVLEKAQAEAKANSNTEGNVRKLTPAEEAKRDAPDLFAAAQAATETVAESGSGELSDMTREELFAAADEMGIKVDKRTGHAKLVEIIEQARAQQEAPQEGEEVPADDQQTTDEAGE